MTMMDIWQAALLDLQTKVSTHNFNTWFCAIEFQHTEGRIVHLGVRDKFIKEWLEENYIELIEASLSGIRGDTMRVVLHDAKAPVAPVVPPSAPQPDAPSRAFDLPPSLPQAAFEARTYAPSGQASPQTTIFSLAPTAAPPITAVRQSLSERVGRAQLNARYSFDEFVVGPSNQFAHAACASISGAPGKNYNPLFIFGGVGLGKTHLLHAVGIEILRQSPDARVFCLSSEVFMNELITSLRQKEMSQFRARYRNNCDVLLIDDIQFIGGKDSTQEEFFHTFNALHHHGAQIIMTSDKPPRELPGIEERLRSRFSWGLIADIQPPEMETRVAILEKKAQADGISLSPEVAMMLATSVRSNVRALEGTLVSLSAQAELLGICVTPEMAREHLRRLNLETQQSVSAERIIQSVAEYFGITSKDICGARRNRSISEPRQYAMYITRKLTDHSLPEIGRSFGGKDHTTVLAACRKFEKLEAAGGDIQRTIQELERRLR